MCTFQLDRRKIQSSGKTQVFTLGIFVPSMGKEPFQLKVLGTCHDVAPPQIQNAEVSGCCMGNGFTSQPSEPQLNRAWMLNKSASYSSKPKGFIQEKERNAIWTMRPWRATCTSASMKERSSFTEGKRNLGRLSLHPFILIKLNIMRLNAMKLSGGGALTTSCQSFRFSINPLPKPSYSVLSIHLLCG